MMVITNVQIVGQINREASRCQHDNFFGATTLSIATLSIATLSITTLSITTLSIMTLSITTHSMKGLHVHTA
jgi:hypothetical protein